KFNIGQHGFRLSLPLHFADGEKREIRVVDENGAPLVGSPLSIACYIPNHSDTPQAEIAQQMLQSLQRYIPRGVALDHYEDWRHAFDSAEQLPTQWQQMPTQLQRAHIAVIVYGAAGQPDSSHYEAALQRSLASVKEQLGVNARAFIAQQEFHQTIQSVLESEAEAVVMLRLGDSLSRAALAHAWQALASHEPALLIYSDSELALHGQAARPWFKPAWNPEYAYASDYPLHLMLVKSAVLRHIPWQQATNAAELAWWLLAAAARAETQQVGSILHLPHVLYRFHSVVSEAEREQCQQAAQDCLQREAPSAHLQAMPQFSCAEMTPRLLKRPTAAACRVSLIIPTRDNAAMLARAIDSLRLHTTWPALEIIVVDNGSREAATLAYFAQLQQSGIKVLPAPGIFNFARLNNLAVAAAEGDVVGLINNDIEALHSNWLENMLAHLFAPDVAVVGAKLLWPNRMVQHGGVLLGPGYAASHFGNYLQDDDAGPHARNQVHMEVSAVTAACLLVRKSDYLAVGGMDEQAFPVAFNDVDLCLKLRQSGKRIVWCADAVLLHAESASRGHDDTAQKKARAQRELQHLRSKWGEILLHDPVYHPSLSLASIDHGYQTLALPPRARLARTAR
ncbi:MAG: glycosyltransferase family 2 protein, partial [Burkholderiales bacterium]|nr:glycosyltransferase family 2 protein [Burkholderiales bacterium]